MYGGFALLPHSLLHLINVVSLVEFGAYLFGSVKVSPTIGASRGL